MSATIDPAFAAEFARTLRDEIGARTLYRRLARSESDPELVRLFHVFADEGDSIERSLRALMQSLEARGRVRSVFRWFSARALSALARVGMRRFVLRLCLESEEVLARRYAGFAHWLAAGGRIGAARACDELGSRKATRAHALRAWVPR